MPGENNYFLFLLIEISLKSQPSGRKVGVFDKMLRGLIFGDVAVLEDLSGFGFNAIVELMILGFIVA